MNEYRLLFNTEPVARRCLAYLSVIDVDPESYNLVGIEIVGLLRNSECAGTKAHVPQTLPFGVTYETKSDCLYCTVGIGTPPYGQVHQPKIRTWILLTPTEEISGLVVELPPAVNKPRGYP